MNLVPEDPMPDIAFSACEFARETCDHHSIEQATTTLLY